MQAKYWRCLRPFVEHLSFDPYTSPFADAENAPSTPVSPSGSRPDGSSPRKSAGSGEALVLKAGQPLSTSSHDVARAISRSKIAARRTQVRIPSAAATLRFVRIWRQGTVKAHDHMVTAFPSLCGA